MYRTDNTQLRTIVKVGKLSFSKEDIPRSKNEKNLHVSDNMKMWTKIKMRYHFSPVRVVITKDSEFVMYQSKIKEYLDTLGDNGKLV